MALIGVGENNKFGHPNNEVIQRLEKKNIKIYRTDLNGEITIRLTKNNYKVTTKLTKVLKDSKI